MASTKSSDKVIEQVCAIPYRRQDDQLEFCLITSLKKKRWIFPKGIIDPGETGVETALKEAFEEAGLRGRIVGDPLGSYPDAKWGRQLEVTVVIMEVSQCETQWPEADVRDRRWVDPSTACHMLGHAHMKRFAEQALRQLS